MSALVVQDSRGFRGFMNKKSSLQTVGGTAAQGINYVDAIPTNGGIRT